MALMDGGIDDEHAGASMAHGTMHTASLFLDPDAPAESAPTNVEVSSSMNIRAPVLQQQVSIPGAPNSAAYAIGGIHTLKGSMQSMTSGVASMGSRSIGAAANIGTAARNRVGGSGEMPLGRARAGTTDMPSAIDLQQQQVMLQQQEMIRQQQLQQQLGMGGGGFNMTDGMGPMNAPPSLVVVDLKMPPLAEEVLPSSCASHVDYFNQIAVNGLMRILLDPRTATHHGDAVKAVMRLMQGLTQEKKQCVPLLKMIIPSFVYAIGRTSSTSTTNNNDDHLTALRESLFQELTQLVLIVGADVISNEQQMLTQLLSMAQQYWGDHLKQILSLIQTLSTALSDDFTVYLPELLPIMMQKIREEMQGSDDPKRKDTIRVLRTLHSLTPMLDGFLHLVLPGLMKLVEAPPSPGSDDARRHALLLLRTMCQGTLYTPPLLSSYTPLIHSSHTLLSYTPLLYSCGARDYFSISDAVGSGNAVPSSRTAVCAVQ
jgi:hypothetical protein